MKTFLKENFVLVLGISLPVLLVIAVMALQGITMATTKAPEYGVIFATPEQYHNIGHWHFEVEDKKLSITYGYATEPHYDYHNGAIVLTHYDPKSGESIKETLEPPKNYKAGADVNIDLPDHFSKLSIDDSSKSPDGYQFTWPDYHGGSLFTDIFGYRSNRREYGLMKNGAYHKIPDAPKAYRNTRFIGWAENE